MNGQQCVVWWGNCSLCAKNNPISISMIKTSNMIIERDIRVICGIRNQLINAKRNWTCNEMERQYFWWRSKIIHTKKIWKLKCRNENSGFPHRSEKCNKHKRQATRTNFALVCSSRTRICAANDKCKICERSRWWAHHFRWKRNQNNEETESSCSVLSPKFYRCKWHRFLPHNWLHESVTFNLVERLSDRERGRNTNL